MDILRAFHFYFSVQSQRDQATQTFYNEYCEKQSIRTINPFMTFDQVGFNRPDEKIRYFKLCSTLKNWFLAVFHGRVLQVYDHSSGSQEYEINLPSCRGIHFLDQEKLIILEDGNSTVFVCSIEMQKRSFTERSHKNKKLDDLKTATYEDEHDHYLSRNYSMFQQQTFEKQFNSQSNNTKKVDEQEEEDYEELKDTAGVKKIRFDESIRRVFCSSNTSNFGYIAILGKTKISIHQCYSDEASAFYDHMWTMNQWDFRMTKSGSRMELLDFSNDSNFFITLAQSGELAQWNLQEQHFVEIWTKFAPGQLPMTQMKYFSAQQVMCYSRLHQAFYWVRKPDEAGILSEPRVFRVKEILGRKNDPGECTDFMIDKSGRFLVAVFQHANCLIIVNLEEMKAVYMLENSPMINLRQGVWLDELGFLFGTLDEYSRDVQIWTYEWIYNMQ